MASLPRRDSRPAPAAPVITHRVVTSHEYRPDGRLGRVVVEVAIGTQVGAVLTTQHVKIEVTP